MASGSAASIVLAIAEKSDGFSLLRIVLFFATIIFAVAFAIWMKNK